MPPAPPLRDDLTPLPGEERPRGEAPLVISPAMLAPPAQARAEFEQGMSYRPPATLVLILVLAVVFGWQLATGALASREGIVASGALVRQRVAAGEWWRVITAGFLHGSPDHLIGNAISLYILGMATEHAFGTLRLCGIYLAALLAGSLASLLTSPGPSVGASGAIFGLMGAVIVYLHHHRDRVEVGDRRIGVVIAGWAIYTLLMGALSPTVDNAAHLGGLVGGALAGLVACERPGA